MGGASWLEMLWPQQRVDQIDEQADADGAAENGIEQHGIYNLSQTSV